MLALCSQRGDEFDIYTVPATGGRGKAPSRRPTAWTMGRSTRRTGATSTSERTGRMQIWRLTPDGSEQEQATFGETNDWFLHLLPDGRRPSTAWPPTTKKRSLASAGA